MTIFDVLRYPISYPPTAKELAALPRPLILAWAATHGFEDCDGDPLWISSWYNRNKDMRPSPAREIHDLRNMIKVYEE